MKLYKWRNQVTPASCNSELTFQTTDSQKTPRREDKPISRHFPTQQQHEQPCCNWIQTHNPSNERQYAPQNIWQL